MERTNNPVIEQPIRFKKVGGGSLRGTFNGVKQIIKPGQTFKALPSEIPVNFRDVVIALDSLPDVVPAEIIVKAAVKPVYKLKLRKAADSAESDAEDLYDVVNKAGKSLNDKGLDKETAEKLIQDLAK